MEESANDGLRIRRVAGGCMVQYPPLFSADGNLLFVVYEYSIQAFNVITGEFVRSYENKTSEGYLIGMVVDSNNSKYIHGCTVEGLILSWKIDSGLLCDRIQIVKNKFVAESFYILYDQNGVSSFLVLGKSTKTLFIQYCPHKKRVLEAVLPAIHDNNMKGKKMVSVATPEENIIDATNVRIVASPGGPGLNYFAYIAKNRWYWVRLKPYVFVGSMPHCSGVEPVVLTCHPTDGLIAVGDAIGRVVLYRNFLKKEKIIAETYHWHSHAVKCLSFSSNGTHFYSGGHERVLVKWIVGQEEKADLLPRLTDSIAHITVGSDNLKLVLCTADNGIQILNALLKQTAIVQSFSKISTDVPRDELFPAGLRVNPRTQVIIMNGRIGCIQFFSTYTKSLLYTLDITQRNYNTKEDSSVIHNTVVTNIAVNAHWLATVENWNDHHNSMETRLKFWKYDELRQSYSLGTNLENVHQGGVCDIAFSSCLRERELQCATAGQDNRIKIWSLEQFETTGGGEKLVWTCVGSVQYRNLPVRSISFSHDASLLAGGFGNVLCTWNAETLQLKCALSAPSGYDGCVNRALVILPVESHEEQMPEKKVKKLKCYDEANSKILNEMVALINGNVKSSFFNDITEKCTKQQLSKRMSSVRQELTESVSERHKKYIAQKVQYCSKMNMLQKAELFHALRIGCRTNEEMNHRIRQKLLACRRSSRIVQQRLRKIVDNLSIPFRFGVFRKHRNYERRQMFPVYVRKSLAKIFSHEKLDKTKAAKAKSFDNFDRHTTDGKRKVFMNPMKSFSQIQNVLFCNGQLSHLVVVCTENRLIVWNLLSLKIQVSAAITIDRITLDPFTNLIATFTKDNELYVFLPNISMPLYHRMAMPKVFGAVWIPRRYPSSQSFNVDWQATSQLFFLNAKQELQHLVSDNDEESLGPFDSDEEETLAADGRMNDPPIGLQTPFTAMFAKQAIGSNVQRSAVLHSGMSIGLARQSAVRSIVSSSSHTMAPINLLCKDFLRSLLVVEENRIKERNLQSDHGMLNGVTTTRTTVADGDSDSLDAVAYTGNDIEVEKTREEGNTNLLNENIRSRKAIFFAVNQMKQTQASAVNAVLRLKFRKLVDEPIDIVF